MLQTLIVKTPNLNSGPEQIRLAIDEIKEAYGRSEAAFSGKSYSLSKSIERRQVERIPFEYPIFIRPAEVKNNRINVLQSESIIGLTQDISSVGFGFIYDQPIRSKHVLVEFDLYNSGSLEVLAELRWHKKKGTCSYAGGALIVGVVPKRGDKDCTLL